MITKPELWYIKGIDNLLYIATTLNNIFQQGIVIFADLTKRLKGDNFTNQCLVLNLLYILKQIWQNIQEVVGRKPKFRLNVILAFWKVCIEHSPFPKKKLQNIEPRKRSFIAPFSVDGSQNNAQIAYIAPLLQTISTGLLQAR